MGQSSSSNTRSRTWSLPTRLIPFDDDAGGASDDDDDEAGDDDEADA